MLIAAVATVAVSAGSSVQAACVNSGSTRNCTGDLPAGVQLNNGGGLITTLNVFGLTTNITPVAGAYGVSFLSGGAIELNLNSVPFAIFTTDVDGVFAGSTGGPVSITSIASITTTGYGAAGIRGSSDQDPLTITSQGNIVTDGLDAFGIVAGSTSGAVSITSVGDIATENATGIFAATAGAFGTDEGAITIDSTGNITTKGANADGIDAISASGAITVTSTGDITVQGPGSLAINTWSGADITVTSVGNLASLEDVIPNPSFGTGVINAESLSGNVTITSIGNISSRGNYAAGIAASAGLDATVTVYGSIITTGDNADGIVAVSGNKVLIDSRADIFATGDGSAAIRAAGYAGNEVFNFGTARGGFAFCGCGAGIYMESFSGENTLTNFGSISSVSEMAIFADSMFGNSMVENYGTVTGNVALIGVSAIFTNHAGALFNTADFVDAERVANDGTIAPGGRGTVRTTGLSNDFEQGPTGIYAVDLDPAAGTNDLIVVNNTAQLSGNVAARLLSIPTLATDSWTILSTMSGPGSLIDGGLGLISSPALHAALTFDATDLLLSYSIGFVTDGLNSNQRAIATNIEQIYVAGAGGVSPVLLGLLNVGGLGEYKSALDQLSPEIYSNAEIAALYSSLAFSNSLLSCKVNGTDTASIIHEGQCLWAGAGARFQNTRTTSEQIGSNDTAGLFTAGAQVALDDVWRLGVAGGFQSSTLQTATGASSEGSLGQAGIALKYNPGPLLLAASVTGGGATYDTRRIMSFGGFTGTTESDQTLGIFSGALRAAYVLGSPQLYAKPMLDMSATQLQLSSFTETGSAAALAVEGGGQTVFALTPTVEVGTEFWLSNGTLIRPLIRLGGVFYSGNDLALTAGFADLGPLSAVPGGEFTLTTDTDDAMGLVGAGVDVINGNDAVLRLSYDGQIGQTTQIHAVGIKGSARF